MLLLPVQVGGGGDQTSVRVDAEEFVARAWQQTVPHHGILLWGCNTGCEVYGKYSIYSRYLSVLFPLHFILFYTSENFYFTASSGNISY